MPLDPRIDKAEERFLSRREVVLLALARTLMRSLAAVTVTAGSAAALFVSSAPALRSASSLAVMNDASSAWTFTADPGVRIPSGVSTEVIRLVDGTLLAYVSSSGMPVYRSTDGLTFTQVNAQTPSGSDAAIVPLPDGRLRMYYIHHDPTSGKEIDSAVSSDALTWTVEPGVRVALGTGQAAGVPEAVVLPTGGVRLYYISSCACSERIDSATSSDGLSFTADAGDRLTGGYVDPAVIRLSDGTWLMAVSRTPGEQQRIFLGYSTDGLSWTLDAQPIVLLANNANALDPTLLQLPDGSVRVYFSTAASGAQFTGPYQVISGLLTKTDTATTTTQVAQRKLTVVVKGKGIVKGGSISCPGHCSALLSEGAKTTLTAKPRTGYKLSAWSGACSVKKPTCSLTLHANASVRATFVKR